MDRFKLMVLAIFLVCMLTGAVTLAATVDEFGLPVINGQINDINGTGKIDSLDIKNKEMVVDDQPYTFANDTRFSSEGNQPVSVNYFTTGNYVGFQVRGDNHISQLWKLKDPQ